MVVSNLYLFSWQGEAERYGSSYSFFFCYYFSDFLLIENIEWYVHFSSIGLGSKKGESGRHSVYNGDVAVDHRNMSKNEVA